MTVCIVNRGSLSTSEFVLSRSIFCRILEPLLYLTENLDRGIRIISVLENQITDEILKTISVIVFCKHNQDQDLLLLKKCKELGIKVIYDIDDLIYKFTSDSMAYVHMQKAKNVQTMIQESDCVVTSNAELDKRVRADFKVTNSVVIPTGFNTEKYGRKTLPVESDIVLFTNGDNIKVTQFYDGFVKCFNKFLLAHGSVDFRVFGDSEAYLEPFERYSYMGSLSWDLHKEYLLTHDVRFGIVPLGASEESLEHREFSVCKTPIKFYEYGAARIPAIFSNAKIYRDVVEDRVTGLLVDNTEEGWSSALEELYLNYELRLQIGRNALETVRSRHHISRPAKLWLDIIS